MNEKPSLVAYGLSYSWPRRGIRALEDVTLELRRGEITALIGPNGSGKSTLLKILAGLISLEGPSSSGLIQVHGEALRSFSSFARARMVSYISSDFRAEFPLSVFEMVALGQTSHESFDSKSASIREALERTSSWELRDRDVRELSGGEKQLVLLARALVQKARILLLDETLSRMDLHHQAATGKLLRELAAEGYTILLVAHDLNLALEWASNCVFLNLGRVIASGSVAVTLNERNLSVLYPNAPLLIAQAPETGTPKVYFKKSL